MGIVTHNFLDWVDLYIDEGTDRRTDRQRYKVGDKRKIERITYSYTDA